MEHGNPTAYAAHRKAGEKPCDDCRADANRRSKESRERKKAHKAQLLGIDIEAKPKRAVSLRDYAADLVAKDLSNYTHVVHTRDGRQFSIHTNEEDADRAAAMIKDGSVHPFTPHMTDYWTSTKAGERYDH